MNEFAKEIKIDGAYKTGLAGRSKELGRTGYYFMLAFTLVCLHVHGSGGAI